MNEMPPCKGCTDRHEACHGSCDAYKEWAERYRAQQKHLKENSHRFHIPITASREKAYQKHYPNGRKYTKGGSYE